MKTFLLILFTVAKAYVVLEVRTNIEIRLCKIQNGICKLVSVASLLNPPPPQPSIDFFLSKKYPESIWYMLNILYLKQELEGDETTEVLPSCNLLCKIQKILKEIGGPVQTVQNKVERGSDEEDSTEEKGKYAMFWKEKDKLISRVSRTT